MQLFELHKCRVAEQTALHDGLENGHLVVVGLAKRSSVVQVHRERLVAQRVQSFVVVSIHVAGEEVECAHVHDVEQHLGMVANVLEDGLVAIVRIRFPTRLFLLVVAAAIWVAGHRPVNDGPTGQEQLNGALEAIDGLAANRVRRVTVVRAVTGEADVVDGRVEEGFGELGVRFGPEVGGDVE